MNTTTNKLAALLLVLCGSAAGVAAHAAQSSFAPPQAAYKAPMAVIDGSGAIGFHVTFGMLFGADGAPVGLYRSYPSKSNPNLIEKWSLGMLGTRAGVVLASFKNTPILALHGRIDPGVGTYPLTLTYLTNTPDQRYASCVLRIQRTPAGQWQTVDSAGRRVATISVVSHGLGISQVTGCGPRVPR